MSFDSVKDYIIYIVIPYALWVTRSLFNKPDRSEVTDMIDQKMKVQEAVQQAHKEDLQELKESQRIMDAKLDVLLEKVAELRASSKD